MNGKPAVNLEVDIRGRLVVGSVATLGVMVFALAVSNQSFWIDEVSTAHKAITPTLKAWWERLRAEGTSNLQLPLYMLYAWAWEKLLGPEEWALRAGNIPWLVLALVVVNKLFRQSLSLRVAVSLVLLLNAFVWCYLNEARPYAMQIGASVLAFAALYRLSWDDNLEAAEERSCVLALATGTLILCASGLLAVIWYGAGVSAALLVGTRYNLQRLYSEYRRYWIFTGTVLLGLGLFYFWTFKIGARATTIGTTDFRNIFYLLYELFGFSGLGPGRMAIRTQGLAAFQPYWPWLLMQGVLTVVVLAAGARCLLRRHGRKSIVIASLCLSTAALFLLITGRVAGFRILGRHCAPLFPSLLLLSGLGLMTLWEQRHWLARSVVAGFICCNLLSCLSVRFAERHAKDNYREAASLAKVALKRGEIVWWNADQEAPIVYGLPVAGPPGQTGKALLLFNPPQGFDSRIPPPDWILSSKPDVYDVSGALAEYVVAHGYRHVSTLQAFTVWQRKN